MATNTVLFDTTVLKSNQVILYRGGDQVDDASEAYTLIRAAGGVCWPTSDIATASALAQAQLLKGRNSMEVERALMIAAIKSGYTAKGYT